MTWQQEIDIAVDLERQRANAAEARADKAEARADEAETRADEAEARADRYEKMLRELGKLQFWGGRKAAFRFYTIIPTWNRKVRNMV